MTYSHVLITRPLQESMELSKQLQQPGLTTIILPAFEFFATALDEDAVRALESSRSGASPLLVFTSTRSVKYGLPQIPPEVLSHAQVAAIGASTAAALQDSGVAVAIKPRQGYTSECLLEAIKADSRVMRQAEKVFIVSAPGGRSLLHRELGHLGFHPTMLMAYGKRSADLDPKAVRLIKEADKLMAVWTSANSMKSLSQRLPSKAWLRLCQSDWLVVSERLKRVARAYSPASIHISAGPSNRELAMAVQNLLKTA